MKTVSDETKRNEALIAEYMIKNCLDYHNFDNGQYMLAESDGIYLCNADDSRERKITCLTWMNEGETCKCNGLSKPAYVSLDIMKMALYDAKNAWHTWAIATDDGGIPSFWNSLKHPNELKILYGI